MFAVNLQKKKKKKTINEASIWFTLNMKLNVRVT